MTESKSVALPLGEFPMILERVKRIELSQPAWKAGALPLSYTRRGMKTSQIKKWSGRRDSDPRHPPWQGGSLPLSYYRTFHIRHRVKTGKCVRTKRLELLRPKAPDPKSGASAIPPRPPDLAPKGGDPSGTRTPDTLIKSQVLYHLS